MTSANSPYGQQPTGPPYQNSEPASNWNPVALLDPRRAPKERRTPMVNSTTTPVPAVAAVNGANGRLGDDGLGDDGGFHFSTPSDPLFETSDFGPVTPTHMAHGYPPASADNTGDEFMAVPSRGSVPTSAENNRMHVPTNGFFKSSLSPAATKRQQLGGGMSPQGTMGGERVAGQGGMIERMAHVAERDMLHPPKKRRVEDWGAVVKSKGSFGNGALGDYMAGQNEMTMAPRSTTPCLTVDLTGDDDSTPQVDSMNVEVCYGSFRTSINCHVVPSPKPGQTSMFGSDWAPLVKIMLRRLVSEQTQSARIDVCDHTRKAVGLVHDATAQWLAPLLDQGLMKIRTEGRIPPRRLSQGETAGQPTSMSYNAEINLYGPRKYGRTVGDHLSKHHVKLGTPNMVAAGIKTENPHGEQYKAQVVKKSPMAFMQPYSPAPTRTVEEIRNDALTLFDQFGDGRDFNEAEAPPDVVTPLLKHQKQGLFFLQAREGTVKVANHRLSLWKKMQSAQTGNVRYVNIITGDVRPSDRDCQGGILADMMGLGKTLSILCLVVGSKKEAEGWSGESPKTPMAPTSKHSKSNSHMQSLSLTTPKRNAKSTLLVCPLSTVTNWEEQIKQHIKPGSLKYYIYHGANRIKDLNKLADFDLIITTYGSVSSELGARSKRKAGSYPLEEICWFRIVLDEAHMIREQSTLQFKAIVRLQADRRWAVTGTPVQNRLDDLGALLAFIRLEPFHDRNEFQRHIVEPFKAADPKVVEKLRTLVDAVTIRRLKDRIDLPPRSDTIVKLQFTPAERNIYELFARNANDRVKVLAGPEGARNLRGKSYMHILRAILRLRLICAHGKDLLNEDDLAVLQGMTADLAIDLDNDDDTEDNAGFTERRAYEVLALMQETDGDNCYVCEKKLGFNDSASIDSEGHEDLMGYMNPCLHIFCCSCFKLAKEQYRSNLQEDGKTTVCHICHAIVPLNFAGLKRTKADVEHNGPPEAGGDGGDGGGGRGSLPASGKGACYSGPSTKAMALVADLQRNKAESASKPDEPPYKSVVFSAWTSHLDLLQKALDAADIRYVRLDGRMTRQARTAAMDAFRDDNDVQIILVSIMAGGLGLNLTAGNTVYVMEPQYNPAAEAQAIDRVHRLGQKRPVKTVRYIMENSFEEKMLELQEKKRKLANLSMDSRGASRDKAEATRQKLMDLRSLFK